MAYRVKDFEAYLKRDCFSIFDDFFEYTSGDQFTTVGGDSGTCAAVDADSATSTFATMTDLQGGILQIDPVADAETDNHQVYAESKFEVFKFATDKPLFFAAKVKPVANTIASVNLMIGLIDGVADDALQDTGAGPKASYSGAVFFAADGTNYWQCESSIAAAQTTVNTGKAIGNNAWDVLVIETIPISSTTTEVHFFFGNEESTGDVSLVEVGKTTVNERLVAQTITHTNATQMQIVLGAKDGVINNGLKLFVDWVYAAQRR